MPDIHGYCALCASKCATIATVEADRLIAVRPDRNHPNVGFCVKAGASPELVHSSERIRTPLKRTRPKSDRDAGWIPITWDEALATISERLLKIKAESGAEAVAFGRPSPGGSHACDWSPFLDRLSRVFGSPNVISSSHICQWGRDTGSNYTYGTTLPTPHFEASKTILIWGHNPEASHIQNWLRIRESQRNGARLIVIDPRHTGTVDRADLWIRPTPGSDTAIALGAIHVMIRERLYNHQFLTHWTNAPFLISTATGQPLRGRDIGHRDQDGYLVWNETGEAAAVVDVAGDPSSWGIEPALAAKVDIVLSDGTVAKAQTAFSLLGERVSDSTPEQVAERTGVPADKIVEFARLIGTGGPLSYYTYNGVEQHNDTAQTNRAICILYALTGWLEAEGGNVTFAGIPTDSFDGFDLLDPIQNKKRLGFAQRPLSAARRSIQAYNFYDAALGAGPYKVRALVSFGGNVIIQNGDTLKGRRALEALEFQVHADLFLNPSAETADIVLPTSTPWESPNVTLGFSGGPQTLTHIQYRPAVVPPQFDSRSDMQAIFDLAVTLGIGDKFWNGDVEAAFRALLLRSGVSLEQLKASPGGIHFDTKQSYRNYAKTDAKGRVQGFNTPSRKVEIYSQIFLDQGYDPLPSIRSLADAGEDYPLRLTSYKLMQYCHSQGRGIASLRRQAPGPFIEIHPETAARFNIENGDHVAVKTPHGQIELPADVTTVIPPGVVASHTGWWEACHELGLPGYDPFSQSGANLNLIMSNDETDPISGSVPHKSYPCSIHKIDRPSRAQTSGVESHAFA